MISCDASRVWQVPDVLVLPGGGGASEPVRLGNVPRRGEGGEVTQ